MPSVNFLESGLAALVVVDVQEKMLGAITSGPKDAIIDKIKRMIGAAAIFDIPILWTEQYPKGLGGTAESVREALPAGASRFEKTTCSCWRDDDFRQALQATEREHVILIGLETHVCIQQTALDLLRVDYSVFVPEDAIGSRFNNDHAVGVARMRNAGVEISTAESLMFELIERCDHPKFKEMLQLVK